MNKYVLILLPFAILTIHLILKTNHPIMSSITSSISGVIMLILIESISNFTGVSIPLNLITLASSVLLGVPGVGTIMILDTLTT